jgi:succinate dehydrogenase/fumarate reductase flavoprotein subunit
VRTLATGETSIMTRSEREGVVACVHDGRAVVYQAKVELPDEEMNQFPFVMLEGGSPPVNGTCLSVRELYWGSRFVGWAAEPTCENEGMGHGPH